MAVSAASATGLSDLGGCFGRLPRLWRGALGHRRRLRCGWLAFRPPFRRGCAASGMARLATCLAEPFSRGARTRRPKHSGVRFHRRRAWFGRKWPQAGCGTRCWCAAAVSFWTRGAQAGAAGSVGCLPVPGGSTARALAARHSRRGCRMRGRGICPEIRMAHPPAAASSPGCLPVRVDAVGPMFMAMSRQARRGVGCAACAVRMRSSGPTNSGARHRRLSYNRILRSAQ